MIESYSKSETRLMSEDIRQLAQAFLKAKKMMGGAKKTSKGNFGKYADIGDVYEAVEDALYANNIIVWHFGERISDTDQILHTRLIHATTGQFIEDTRTVKSEKPGNQGLGAAYTYMRRYALLCLCSVYTEDDDGNAEQKHIKEQLSKPKEQSYKSDEDNKKVYPSQLKELLGLLSKMSDSSRITFVEDVLTELDIEQLDDMPFSKFPDIKKMAEDKSEVVTPEQLEEIVFEIGTDLKLADKILSQFKVKSLSDIPKSQFRHLTTRIREIKQMQGNR